MITLMDVYDAFLARVNEDDWANAYDEEDLEWFMKDWRQFLNMALAQFKFPRCNLDINEEKQEFIDPTMGQAEIQVLATFMKYEWLKRTVDSWENIKTQYEEKDFSQANLLRQFINLKNQVELEAKNLERIDNMVIEEAYKDKMKRKLYGLLREREKDGEWEKFLDNILIELGGYSDDCKTIEYYTLYAKLSSCRYLSFKYYRKTIFECMNLFDTLRIDVL